MKRKCLKLWSVSVISSLLINPFCLLSLIKHRLKYQRQKLARSKKYWCKPVIWSRMVKTLSSLLLKVQLARVRQMRVKQRLLNRKHQNLLTQLIKLNQLSSLLSRKRLASPNKPLNLRLIRTLQMLS